MNKSFVYSHNDQPVNKWDGIFMNEAYIWSQRSKDPSTKVGAVITRGKKLISVGYNGFPENVRDDEKRYADRELKYLMIVHAELNAILTTTENLAGCSIYTWPFLSCSSCAGAIIQKGIKRIIAPESDVSRWKKSFDAAMTMYKEADVLVTLLKEVA